MIKNLLKLSLISITLLTVHTVSAQKTCGSDYVNNKLFEENPLIKNQYLRRVQETAQNLNINQRSYALQEILEVPVVVHVLEDGNPQYQVTEQEIIDWIDNTNQILAGTKQGILSPNNGGANIPIRLVLAKRDIENRATNGIKYYDLSNNTDYVNYGIFYDEGNGNGLGVNENNLIDNKSWDSNSYYNLYITNKINGIDGYIIGNDGLTISGISGYAYYPNSANDWAVIVAREVNSNSTTLAHEIMHAFNLAHVFEGGESDGSTCGSTENDGIADTQRTKSMLNTNPQPTNSDFNSCANTNYDGVQYNIMNYGYILDRFTIGQANFVYAVNNNQRKTFKTSLGAQAPSTNPTTGPIDASCNPGTRENPSFFENELNQLGFGIETISLTTLNNSTSSARDQEFYFDYTKNTNVNTSYIAELIGTETVTIKLGTTVLAEDGEYPARAGFKVYIDYNNNGIFEAEESISLDQVIELGNTDFDYKETEFYFNAPSEAVKNTPLRMRVIGDIYDFDVAEDDYFASTFDPCGNLFYGEVEDYSVIIRENTYTGPSTIWDGTSWSNGNPTSDKEVIIRGNLTIESPLYAKKFTLESGSVDVIDNGSIISSYVENTLSADRFVIYSKNGVIQLDEYATTLGDFTVIQNSSPMFLNDATLWSSPVSGQNLRYFSINTLLKRFYKYDEPQNSFISLFEYDPLYPNYNLENPNYYEFEQGVGYHIRSVANSSPYYPQEFVGEFVGELNTGNFSVYGTNDSLGYNLVGNPYPSPINNMSFLSLNPDVEALYFWTQESPLTTNGYAQNNYASYTRAGGVQAAAGGETPNNYTSKAQGFFVKMSNSNLIHFNNSLRNYDGSLPIIMHRNQDITSSKRIRLDLFEDTLAKNQILVSYMENATNNFDHQIDGKFNQMYTGSALYTLIDNNHEKYVIQGRDVFNFNDDVVKLGFEAKASATYTVKIANLENLNNQSIYLKDKINNQVVDLTQTDYNFNSEIGTFNERFELFYSNKNLNTTDNNVSNESVKAVKVNNGIKIISLKDIKSIEIYDVSGRKISTQNLINKRESLITNITKSNQMLVIKVTSIDGIISTLKIVY